MFKQLLLLILIACLAFDAISQKIVINEVMANAIDEDTGEFIELLNIDNQNVDLRDWKFTDGDSTDTIQSFQNSPTILPPNRFAVILDAEYADDYDLPADAILLTTKNTTLGNGLQLNDPITLFNNSEKIIDTFTPPFKAKNGVSIERIDPNIGDVPENWQNSTDKTGSSPGRPNSQKTIEIEPNPENLPPLELIVINEIMHSPDTSKDQTEWIELLNPTLRIVKITNWRIEDASEKSAVIENELLINPEGFLILTKNLDKILVQFPDLDPRRVVEISLPSLNNSGDTISLIDPFDRIVDRVIYKNGSSIRGRSLERVNFSINSKNLENWKFSADLSGATPAEINSHARSISGKLRLEITPSPFEPRSISTLIAYETPISATLTIQIFDSAGRLKRTLIDAEPVGGKQWLTWDGRNENGDYVEIGVYICQLIAITDEKKHAQRLTKTIVVASEK